MNDDFREKYQGGKSEKFIYLPKPNCKRGSFPIGMCTYLDKYPITKHEEYNEKFAKGLLQMLV